MATTEPISDGFIKTVLKADSMHVLDDSSLALPAEPQIKTFTRHTGDPNSRVLQQVQLTISRRSKKAHSNDYLDCSGSISEVTSKEGIEKDSAASVFGLRKPYKPIFNQNGYSTAGHFYRTNENALGQEMSHQQYVQGKFQYHLHKRATTLPVAQIPLTQAYRMESMRLSAPNRYAHSEITNYNKYRTPARVQCSSNRRQQYTNQMQLDDNVFLDSAPNSPARGPSQRVTTSRSLTNILNMDTTGAALQQSQMLKNSVYSQRGRQSQRYSWRQRGTTRDHMQENVLYGSRPPSATSVRIGGNFTGMTPAILAHREGYTVQNQMKQESLKNEPVDLTLDRAVNLLSTGNTEWQIAAASFIQHECFVNKEAKRLVFSMHGIPKLLQVMENDNEHLQCAAVGALRNIVFEDSENKKEVTEKNGIPILLQLLRQTRDMETKKQITGLLWNLSSSDDLKHTLISKALQPLTKSIIIPCSGWPDGDCPKEDLLHDPEVFYNATGCLRNLSSAGPEGRKMMRECESLIDSLVHYVRGSIADYQPDNKATENCVCILHNLSYQLETELPSQYFQDMNILRHDLPSQSKGAGCFGSRSSKIKQKNESKTPYPEEKSNPRGVEWLWNPITVRMYLSVIAKSTRSYTQEASIGALQNLTAGTGGISYAIAETIVQKENGLQHIRRMLHSSEPGVQKAAASLLRNMSRYYELHKELANQVLPDVVSVLPMSASDPKMSNDVIASLCCILNNLVQSSSQNARLLLSNDGLKKTCSISCTDSYIQSKAGKAASMLLCTMWKHSELHSVYKKAGYKKGQFINSRTMKAARTS
ncbi:plakophilin-2 [Polypterus senegalus]|uniref:plakophilin-2 n=1 Tax=Polypterus senegalus TaxID=55291 RepID=UPI0019644471|nr:plakophilin-2 [Polypterus senegalus]